MCVREAKCERVGMMNSETEGEGEGARKKEVDFRIVFSFQIVFDVSFDVTK